MVFERITWYSSAMVGRVHWDGGMLFRITVKS